VFVCAARFFNEVPFSNFFEYYEFIFL
jgi:hypothetical protein